MKSRTLLAGVALAITAVFALPNAALATEACTPSDAWTETIEHEAVGEPTIVIENPDYVPATEGYYTTEDNPDYVPATDGYYTTEDNPDYVPATPDTTETVHHDAVTHLEWKYTKHGGYGFIWVNNNTFKYIDQYGNGSNSKPNKGWYYERTQHTRTVVDCEAWDEVITIPGTPAQGEPTIQVWHDGTPAQGEPTIQVWHDGTPAQGEPTIEVENPEYIPAWTETIEHEAVVCPVDPTEPEPPVVVDPEPVPPVIELPPLPEPTTDGVITAVDDTDQPEVLATTGSDSNPWIVIVGFAVGGALVIGGVLAFAYARRNK